MSNVIDLKTKKPVENDPVKSLEENLRRLEALHARLKKMLSELEELAS